VLVCVESNLFSTCFVEAFEIPGVVWVRWSRTHVAHGALSKRFEGERHFGVRVKREKATSKIENY
jgi:hypothetical protein